MNILYEISPCVSCARVPDPDSCENKNCQLWRKWFAARWELLHEYPRRQMDQVREPMGIAVGGRHYAAPHQVRSYLEKDPCGACSCGADICRTPCRARQNWAKAVSR